METPHELQRVGDADSDVMVRRYDYGEETVVSVDLDPSGARPSLDVVDDTAIVVVDGKQFEFEVPEGADEVSVNGGVLTIRESSR